MPSDNLKGREVTAMLDYLAERATEVIRSAFPKDLDATADAVPGLHAKALSQARGGARTNAIYRAGLYLIGQRATGRPESHAMVVTDFLVDFRRWLWRDVPVCAKTASIAEQDSESAENPLQIRYAHGDTTVRAALISALREKRAAIDEFIAALETEHFIESRRWSVNVPRGWMSA